MIFGLHLFCSFSRGFAPRGDGRVNLKGMVCYVLYLLWFEGWMCDSRVREPHIHQSHIKCTGSREYASACAPWLESCSCRLFFGSLVSGTCFTRAPTLGADQLRPLAVEHGLNPIGPGGSKRLFPSCVCVSGSPKTPFPHQLRPLAVEHALCLLGSGGSRTLGGFGGWLEG